MKLKIIIEDVDVSDNKLELLLALLAGKDVEVQKNEPVNDGVNLDDLPSKPIKVSPVKKKKPKKAKTEVKKTKRPRGRPPAGKVWDEEKGAYVSKARHKRPRGRAPTGMTWDYDNGKFVPTDATESKGKSDFDKSDYSEFEDMTLNQVIALCEEKGLRYDHGSKAGQLIKKSTMKSKNKKWLIRKLIKHTEEKKETVEVAKAKAKRTATTKPEKKGKKKAKNSTSGWTAEKRKAAADRMKARHAKLKTDKGRAAYTLLTNVEVRDMVAGVVVERQNSMVSSDLITTSYFAGIQKKYHARDANLLAEKKTLGGKIAKYLEVLADALGPTQAMGMQQGDSYNVGLFPKKELKLKKVTRLIGLQS